MTGNSDIQLAQRREVDENAREPNASKGSASSRTSFTVPTSTGSSTARDTSTGSREVGALLPKWGSRMAGATGVTPELAAPCSRESCQSLKCPRAQSQHWITSLGAPPSFAQNRAPPLMCTKVFSSLLTGTWEPRFGTERRLPARWECPGTLTSFHRWLNTVDWTKLSVCCLLNK